MNTTMTQKNLRGQNEKALQETRQLVTFMIANESYGVPVLKVQEIIGMTEIVHVPNSAEFIKGVINLRGSVVPVVDMRKRFNMEERKYDMFTVIIIVEIQEILMGMIVDSVSDVVDIPLDSIQNTPSFSTKIDSDFMEGIGQINDKMIIILNIDRIFSTDEIQKLEQGEPE